MPPSRGHDRSRRAHPHLNPLQEAVQDAGDVNFAGLAKKIEEVCKKIEVPVIAKEVGWGISEKTAKLLADCGVSQSMLQAQAGQVGRKWKCTAHLMNSPVNSPQRLSAGAFQPSDSILNVKKAVPDMTIFASGGIKDGLDIAKCIALGATLGGMAGQFLKAAAVSTEKAVEMMKLTKRQIEVTMFAAGVEKLEGLKVGKLHELK